MYLGRYSITKECALTGYIQLSLVFTYFGPRKIVDSSLRTPRSRFWSPWIGPEVITARGMGSLDFPNANTGTRFSSDWLREAKKTAVLRPKIYLQE